MSTCVTKWSALSVLVAGVALISGCGSPGSSRSVDSGPASRLPDGGLSATDAGPLLADGGPGEVDAGPGTEPEPNVAAWLGTVQFGTVASDGAYGVVAAAGGEVYVVGGVAAPGAPVGDAAWAISRLSRTGAVRWTVNGHSGVALRGALGPDDSLLVVGTGGVSRYAADGTELWHALDGMEASDLGVAPDGAVVVGGRWLENKPFPVTSPALRPSIGSLGGTYDGWVIRLTVDQGSVVDGVQIGTNKDGWVNSIAVGPDGSIYATGPTDGTLPGATHYGDPTDGNLFALKLKPDLSLDWAVQPNGGQDQGNAIRLDAQRGRLSLMAGHGSGLWRLDASTGATLSQRYVSHVAGTELALDAAGRAWFVGSTATGQPAGFVTLVDVDDTILGTHWYLDSPSLGLSYTGDLWGQVGSHVWGVGLDAQGYAWIAGDVTGDLEHNTAVATPQQPADPSIDAFVARLTPSFVRDGVRLLVDKPATTLAVGATETLSVTVQDGDGHAVDVPPGTLRWTSELPNVATVDANGNVSAVAGGRTNVIAHLGRAASEPALVTVTDAAHPNLGRTLVFGTDHGEAPTVVIPDRQAGADQGAVIAAGWTNGPLASQGGIPDYDVMHGGQDAFIAHVSGAGAVSSVIQFGGSDWDSIDRLVLDAAGNTYIVGTTTEPLPESYLHRVIASFDPQGHPRWSIEPGFQPIATQWTAVDLAFDPAGQLYALGNFDIYALLVNLDPATGAELSRWTNPFNAAGTELSASQMGYSSDGKLVLIGSHNNGQFAWAMGLDPSRTAPSGGPVVTFFQNYQGSPATGAFTPPRAFTVVSSGAAMGDFYFGTATATGVLNDRSGLYRGKNGTVTRFGPDGLPRWSTPVAPPGASGTEVTVSGLAADADGNVYAVGSVDDGIGYVAADPGTYYDAYIAKLDAATGDVLWGHMLQSTRNDYATAVTLGPDGTVTAVGYTFGDLDGSAARGRHDKEACDVFVARFAPDGSRR